MNTSTEETALVPIDRVLLPADLQPARVKQKEELAKLFILYLESKRNILRSINTAVAGGRARTFNKYHSTIREGEKDYKARYKWTLQDEQLWDMFIQYIKDKGYRVEERAVAASVGIVVTVSL